MPPVAITFYYADSTFGNIGFVLLVFMLSDLPFRNNNQIFRQAVGKYSLGMRQRLGIAQAIMENPEALVLDEPMNGLDNHGVEDIRKLLLDLKADGRTILIASHNREDIEILCDVVYEMDGGVLSLKSVNNSRQGAEE